MLEGREAPEARKRRERAGANLENDTEKEDRKNSQILREKTAKERERGRLWRAGSGSEAS